jgi:hypothetical protein
VDKLTALADGLRVDPDELFHVACAQLDDGRTLDSRSGPPNILDTVKKIVLSPDLTKILDEVVRLSPEERTRVIQFMKDIDSAKRKRKQGS